MIAALPREIAGLVRGERADAALVKDGVWLYRVDGAVVVAAGMGAKRAAVAVETALAEGGVGRLMSVGVAGACDPRLRVGDVVRAGVVVEERTGERFVEEEGRQIVVTSERIANVEEKRRLFETYGASAVDMEAATVGRMARMHGLSFAAIKTISDEAGFELPELGRFATSDGQFREGAFAFYAALHPGMWGTVVRLGKNSKVAVAALTRELRGELARYQERT